MTTESLMMKKHVKNAHMGTHLLLEVYNVSFEKLNDRDKIEQVCENACKIEELKMKIEIKEKLKNLTSLAFENDVFGAPTFVVNDKLFWGQDRLEYALDEYNS